jgi:FkbM family methyltransferase
MPSKRTLKRFGVAKGDIVIDVGAGSGYFSLPAAEMVGAEGEVFAIDIQPEAITLIERKCLERGRKNLRAILSSPSIERSRWRGGLRSSNSAEGLSLAHRAPSASASRRCSPYSMKPGSLKRK